MTDGPDWQFDHLGMVVRNLAKGRSQLTGMLGIADWTTPLTDTVNGVHLQFGRDPSGMVYELLEPIDAASPVHAALNESRAILNHLAYRTGDLSTGAERMRAIGAGAAGDPKPALAYHGARIQFFVTPLRFIVELIEAPGHVHLFDLATRTARQG